MKESGASSLLEFINRSVSPFHAVEALKEELEGAGFTQLDPAGSWNTERGKGYFIIINDSALVAFRMGGAVPASASFRILASHVDSPTFRVKPRAEMVSEKHYLKLNTEVYGGPILNTWMDRPLSLAGRIITKGRSPMEPEVQLVTIDKPLMVIPNLAIHQNREVNKGVELNRQKDMLPLMALLDSENDKEDFLINLLQQECDITSDILDMDLVLYEHGSGATLGAGDELILAPRIDNLASVKASLDALINSSGSSHTQVLSAFHNEEVGSATRMGADSPMLAMALERIILAAGGTREDYLSALHRSFMVSADGAHGVHPNSPDKSDPTNRPLLGKGPAIKSSASMSYTTDGYSASLVKSLCASNDIPCQDFVNRSDERGGSTIGPLSATHVPVPSVDMGIPILAMHSARETAAVKDMVDFTRLLTVFLEVQA